MVLLMNSIVQEAERFVDLSYKLQVQYHQRHSKDINTFIILTKFSKQNVRKFSAAGFFEIKKNIIFAVVGNVATYFIISVQFNQSEKQI